MGLGAAVCLLPQSLLAQADATNGHVVGQVLDPSGGAVVGAEVTVRNIGTNYTRATTTDEAGRYAVGPVPLGTYEVTVKPANLEPSSQQVYVSLGGRATANFDLGIQAVRESVNVVADAPAVIEPAQTFSKAVLTNLQLRNLPAPGRRVRQLFLLTPTTQIEPECGGFSIAGQKGVYTSLNVDGSDYTSSHFCGHVEMGPTITIEAMEEFQVLRSTFSAEFGRSTGGIINMATKSGTNRFHGTAFYLFRNDALTKRDVFDREQIGLGNQLGGSIGGPIRTDRTFFFSAGEIQRNSKPVQVLYDQLDVQGVRSSAGAQALLAVAPEDSLTAISQFQSFINRIDHAVNDTNRLTGRLDYTRSKVTSTAGSFINTNGLGADSVTNRDVANSSPTSNRTNVTGVAQLSTVVSPRTINEFRVALQREYRPWDPGSTPEVTVRNGSPIRTLAIYGAQGTGLSYGNVGYKFTDKRYQFVDNFSVVTGAHTLKMGVDANLVFGETVFNPGFNGTYRFDSLTSYLARQPAQYDQFAGSGTVDSRKHQIAFYLQDEWRALPGFTISPGFRYEMALMPNYLQPTVPANRAPQATEIPSDKRMFGPRLGMAWDVNQNSRTVLRAAAGVFYAPPYLAVFEQAVVSNGGNPELSSRVTLTGSSAIQNAFRNVGVTLDSNTPLENLPVLNTSQLNQLSDPASRLTQSTAVYFFDPDYRIARSVQLRAALEHQIADRISASIDYTQIAVSRMDRIRDVNLPLPTVDSSGRPVFTPSSSVSLNSLRPNPRFGPIYITESSARSLYRSMTTTLNIRRQRYVFDAAYTLGFLKSHDDHENGGFSSPFYMNAFDLDNEYGWSNIDQRHQFMANNVVFLPAGFELSSTMRFNSGRPFSPRTGSDSNRDGIVTDRPLLNGSEAERNTFRNRGYADVSLRVQKNFILPNEKGTLSFSGEFFNLLDFDNVEISSANQTYGNDLGAPTTNANFGKVKDSSGNYITGSTLRTSPFQVQLGVRFEF
jgi:hypothetical protein